MARRGKTRKRPAGKAEVPRLLLVAPPRTAAALRPALDAQGWRVEQAQGVREVEAQLTTSPVDLLLVAERPTPAATLALLRRLNHAAPGTRSIVLAARNVPAKLLDYANRGGAQRVLEPPVSGRRVVQAVQQVWEAQAQEHAALLRGTKVGAALAVLQARLEAHLHELEVENRELRRGLRELRGKNRALLQLTESLRIQSTTDPLTGLFNRREFLNRIRTEWGRFRRYSRPLSLIMIDIDHFKAVNDTYGHECGDAVLSELGRLIASKKRAQDLTCRYGGEEFVVLLTETSLDAAFHVAEGLRRLVAAQRFMWEGTRLDVRVSLGVAGALEQNPPDVEAFINMADKAMYRAKREGRNRTVVLDAADESRIARQSRGGAPPQAGKVRNAPPAGTKKPAGKARAARRGRR